MSSKLTVSASRRQVLRLYRDLMQEASGFASYNYREYALRRIRDAFHEHKEEHDSRIIKSLIDDARRNLTVVKRQVLISQMYKKTPSVLEHLREQTQLKSGNDRTSLRSRSQ